MRLPPPQENDQFIPGQKGRVKISIQPQRLFPKKKIKCEGHFMDKQFETPLSSRSNSPHSESSFTNLFIYPGGSFTLPLPYSSFSSCPPLSGSLLLGMRARPISGPLHTTGLENPTPFSFPPCISFHCLYRLFRPPKIFKQKILCRIGPWGNTLKTRPLRNIMKYRIR